MSEYFVGFSTTESEKDAENLAMTIVGEKLAACVQIIPNIRSVYRWKGQLENKIEALTIIKTTDDNIKKLKTRIKELHTYEVPEIIFLPISDGLEEYLSWLDQD